MKPEDYRTPLCLIFECVNCGQIYQCYIPKRIQTKQLNCPPEIIEKAKQSDKEDEESGAIEKVKRMAKHMRAKYVDMSVNEVMQCDCGEVYDLFMYYRQGGEVGG